MLRYLLVFISVAFLGACQPGGGVNSLLSIAEEQEVKVGFDALERNQPELLVAKFPAEAGAAREAFPGMVAAFPPAPRKTIVLQSNIQTADGGRDASVVYEIQGGGKFALVDALVETRNGQSKLAGFHIRPASQSALAAGSFDAGAHGAKGYAMIAAAIAAIVITIAGIWRIWRRNLGGRRWLWTLGALFGIGALRMDWASGAIGFNPFNLQLFSAGLAKMGIGPWVLVVAVPVVAIWALLAPTHDDWREDVIADEPTE